MPDKSQNESTNRGAAGNELTTIELELQYILSEFNDFQTVELVEQATGFCFETLPSIKTLREAIRQGNWALAKEELAVLNLHESSETLLNEQIALELVWDEGLTERAVHFIQANVKDLHIITEISSSMLSGLKFSVKDTRCECFQRILYNPRYGMRIRCLLNSAHHFQSIVEKGHITQLAKQLHVKSFVYLDIYLRLLRHSRAISSMEKLKALVANVRVFDESISIELRQAFQQLLFICMRDNPTGVIMLLRGNLTLSNSIQEHLNWTPLSTSVVAVDGFDSIAEFNKRQSGTCPEVRSMLELGQIMQFILDPYIISMPSASEACLEGGQKSNARFPLTPLFRISLGEPVWSLASSPTGKYLAAGTSPSGYIYIFKRKSSHAWKLENFFEGSKSTEQLSFQPQNKLLAARGGEIATFSCGRSHESSLHGPDSTSYTYGSVCWHPENPESFFAGTDSAPTLRMHNCRDECLETEWKLPFYPLMICASEDEILILSNKLNGLPQQLLKLNYKTSHIEQLELPILRKDGMYTTVQCSTWDPRTILLVGSPNCIFIMDKLGKRPTRVLYGPKVKSCLIRARFGGPMDKFIISVSEESSPAKGIVFNRFTGEIVSTLEGHKKQLNDVAWISGLFQNSKANIATASDDGTVIIHG